MSTTMWRWIIGGGAAVTGALLVTSASWIKEDEAPAPLVAAAQAVSLPFAQPTPLPEREKAIRALKLLGKEAELPVLIAAVRNGATEEVALLLQAELSPNASDEDGCPLLIHAVRAGQSETVAQLLKAGATPDTTTPEGESAAQAAVAIGSEVILTQLEEAGADLHTHDIYDHGLLHTAVISGHSELIPSLQKRGLHATGTCCNDTRDLFSHALETRSPGIIATVAQEGESAGRSWTSQSRELLIDSIKTRDRDLITLLLALHGDPPTPEGHRQPLLAWAMAWGQPEVVQLLLECGADPNTPIGSPVEPAFAKLIDHKITRHYLRTEEGMTPLMLAAGLGQLRNVELLLEHGARRGATTRKWRIAALSLAARGKHLEVMQVLLGKKPGQQRVRIEISLASQRANLWKDDKIVYSTRISTGRAGYATPAGEFVITDKHRSRVSSIYHVKMPFFMRLNCSDVGMHAGVVPGYPASHGCIRLPKEAAHRFFKETEVGTLVTIR